LTSWNVTFGQRLTVYHLFPFSLRATFTWADRDLAVRAIAGNLASDFRLRPCAFDELGLRDIPESYRRRHRGWLQITPPPSYVDGMDTRRRRFAREFGTGCPQPAQRQPTVEILIAPSGLGVIRLAQDVEWGTCDDLRLIHASQTPFAHSYFKEGSRDPSLPDDLLRLLVPIRTAILTLQGATKDDRHQLTTRLCLPRPMDFFVGLVVCAAQPGAPDPPRWDELLTAREIWCITGQRTAEEAGALLSCDALLVVGWDESLFAFAGPPSRARNSDQRNAVQLFTLGAMHWAGLYDTDQLLYDSMPFLFERGHGYTKLRLIRGVQAHLAQLQHEAKVSYLSEHEDDQKILSKIFAVWETENLISNLEKKSVMLMGIVDRLNDERLREVGVVFTALSLVGIVSNLGQHRSWDPTGWLWSGVALTVALVGWIVYHLFSRR